MKQMAKTELVPGKNVWKVTPENPWEEYVMKIIYGLTEVYCGPSTDPYIIAVDIEDAAKRARELTPPTSK